MPHDYSFRRTGGCMSEHDFGETYTFLELFFRTYTVHESDVQVVLQAILDTYVLEYNRKDPLRALKELRNPRNAGRKRQITDDTVSQIVDLHSKGHSIRAIADETGIPKSSVQRALKKRLS